MFSTKKHRLAYIRGLMIVSLLLLGVLITSWLDAQYKSQKQQLQKDLGDELEKAQKEVTDSLLYINVIKPVMKVTTFKRNFDEIDTDSKNVHRSVNIDINTSGSFKEIAELGKKISEENKHRPPPNTIVFSTQITKDNNKKITRINNPAASEQLIKDGLSMVMKELYKEAGISEDSFMKFDTAHLQHSFANRLRVNSWPFATAWNDEINNPLKNHKNAITIETSYLSNTYRVAIDDYNTYLFKKITPQFIFSILLLIFVAAAFIISYRSLKEQIRLGVIKNDFISNMSHELKTPISTVKVALEALTTFNVIDNPETTKEYLRMASLEMTRLDMLVNQALNTSLLEEGKITIRKDCIDIKKLTEDIAAILHLRLKQFDATLSIESSGNDFSTKADLLHLQGLIINLIDNSLKYADKTPEINIHIEGNASSLVISVADNGPGISKEHLQHVFDKFFRVPQGDSHNVKGYGLGLSYARQIAIQHEGTLTVRNLDTGGCIFTLTLPKIAC